MTTQHCFLLNLHHQCHYHHRHCHYRKAQCQTSNLIPKPWLHWASLTSLLFSALLHCHEKAIIVVTVILTLISYYYFISYFSVVIIDSLKENVWQSMYLCSLSSFFVNVAYYHFLCICLPCNDAVVADVIVMTNSYQNLKNSIFVQNCGIWNLFYNYTYIVRILT